MQGSISEPVDDAADPDSKANGYCRGPVQRVPIQADEAQHTPGKE